MEGAGPAPVPSPFNSGGLDAQSSNMATKPMQAVGSGFAQEQLRAAKAKGTVRNGVYFRGPALEQPSCEEHFVLEKQWSYPGALSVLRP